MINHINFVVLLKYYRSDIIEKLTKAEFNYYRYHFNIILWVLISNIVLLPIDLSNKQVKEEIPNLVISALLICSIVKRIYLNYKNIEELKE